MFLIHNEYFCLHPLQNKRPLVFVRIKIKDNIVQDKLIEEHASIQVYDPKVTAVQMQSDLNALDTRPESENNKFLEVHANPYEALEGTHALAVITEWDEFKAYDWQKIYDNMLKPAFVFDGRNILDQAALESIGFIYKAVGR